MNRKFLINEGQLHLLDCKTLSKNRRLKLFEEIKKQDITNERAERDQYVFVITKNEIKKMLDMVIKKKDNLLVYVRGHSLGYTIKIKQQYPCVYKLTDKDWIDISDKYIR